jgi:hypothetical protein
MLGYLDHQFPYEKKDKYKKKNKDKKNDSSDDGDKEQKKYKPYKKNGKKKRFHKKKNGKAYIFVVGSPILTPQVTYPQMIVMMKQMRRLPLL